MQFLSRDFGEGLHVRLSASAGFLLPLAPFRCSLGKTKCRAVAGLIIVIGDDAYVDKVTDIQTKEETDEAAPAADWLGHGATTSASGGGRTTRARAHAHGGRGAKP